MGQGPGPDGGAPCGVFDFPLPWGGLSGHLAQVSVQVHSRWADRRPHSPGRPGAGVGSSWLSGQSQHAPWQERPDGSWGRWTGDRCQAWGRHEGGWRELAQGPHCTGRAVTGVRWSTPVQGPAMQLGCSPNIGTCPDRQGHSGAWRHPGRPESASPAQRGCRGPALGRRLPQGREPFSCPGPHGYS